MSRRALHRPIVTASRQTQLSNWARYPIGPGGPELQHKSRSPGTFAIISPRGTALCRATARRIESKVEGTVFWNREHKRSARERRNCRDEEDFDANKEKPNSLGPGAAVTAIGTPVQAYVHDYGMSSFDGWTGPLPRRGSLPRLASRPRGCSDQTASSSLRKRAAKPFAHARGSGRERAINTLFFSRAAI
jgi:hypothetical protein